MRILIAEDDPSLLRALCALFAREKYTVDGVPDGKKALDYLSLFSYDAALLDVMMPGLSGFEALAEARKRGIRTPVLFLTAKNGVDDRVAGLDLGAEDYLAKPFDVRELLARVRSLTRRGTGQKSAALVLGNTSLDTASFCLSAPGGEEVLPNKEFQCLLFLMQNQGEVLSGERFLERFWEEDSTGGEKTLWNVMYNLRRKLETLNSDLAVRTRRGQGYVLEKRDEEQPHQKKTST